LTTCLPEVLPPPPPFLTRPFFAIQRCITLTDNCAVMQCCTQIKFVIFSPQIVFFWWYFARVFLIFCAMKKKKTDNFEKKKTIFLTFCY
ncbi:unnamed protein product, partial [Staurois parvus]